MHFQAQRGIGQGESASSLMWTALYDILLEWIDPSNRHHHTAETTTKYSDEDISETHPGAFADDLVTITGGPHPSKMQQIQAVWISAFCAFSALEMHPDKIKSTIVGPIPQHHAKYITIYDRQWKPIQCPILTTLATYKYLGVHLDLRNNPTASFKKVRQDALDRLSHLLVQPGSPEVKIDYIKYKIMPNILYAAICANWTLSTYRQLDIPFTQAYRKLLSIPSRAPDSLLYLPDSVCGIGLPRVSDRAQKMKWDTFLRCTAVGKAPARSVGAFMDRVPQSRHPAYTPLRKLPCPAGTVAWGAKPLMARSLVEWVHQSGLIFTQRVYETSEEEMNVNRNRERIRDLAQDLEIWPDLDLYGPEQDLRKIKFFATDGSYTYHNITAADVITAETTLRDMGEGAGGIVFIPEDPTQPVKAVRITARGPQPGMNAYTWELVTQLVALSMTRHLPPSVKGFSDCKGAIARNNQALTSHNDTQITTSAGVLTSGTHLFAHPTEPRVYTFIAAHPERDTKRSADPTELDGAIFMADAVAGNTPRAKLGGRLMPTDVYQLQLENIYQEIIPLHRWHLRTNDAHQVPVLDDIIHHQQRATLKEYLAKRDGDRPDKRWSNTSFSFANIVHPPKDNSTWAAARRALIIFDWLAHGANRAKLYKLHPVQQATEAQCRHCGQPDTQEHCMLDCSLPQFTSIRRAARVKQAGIASALMTKHTGDPNKIHFIQMLCHASWEQSSPNIKRVWLGTWTEDLLRQLLKQPATERLLQHDRRHYHKIARKLIVPLREAYYAQIHINITTNHAGSREDQDPLPLYDHFPRDTQQATTMTHASHQENTQEENGSLNMNTQQHLECSHTQHAGSSTTPSLHYAHHLTYSTDTDVSNAAFLLRRTDGPV